MASNKVKVIKEHDGEWYIYNIVTGNGAYIRTINEGGFLASSKKRYRVDNGRGETIASMIDHFATAKSIAMKSVK